MVSVRKTLIPKEDLKLAINAIKKVCYQPDNIVFETETGTDIYGTAGGLVNLKKYLMDDDFLVLNGDILFHSDLKKLVEKHKKTGVAATMLLRNNRIVLLLTLVILVISFYIVYLYAKGRFL